MTIEAPLANPVRHAPQPWPGSWWLVALTWVAGAAILAGLVLFVLHFGDIRLFVATIRAANPMWLVFALLLQAATYICGAAVWQRVLVRAQSAPPFGSLLRLAMIELFANQAVPIGGVSGSLMVLRGLMRRGVEPAIAMTALIVAVFSYFAAYLLAGLLALVLLWHSGDLSAAWRWLFTAFAAIMVAAVGLALAVSHLRGRVIPRAMLRYGPLVRLAALLDQTRFDMLANPGLISEAVGLQFLIFLLDAATLWSICCAVGLSTTPAAAFLSFVLASVVGTLSPIPLGLGTFEGTCTAVLHLFGGGLEASLAATLLLRGLTLWVPMVPGLWFIRRETRSKSGAASPHR